MRCRKHKQVPRAAAAPLNMHLQQLCHSCGAQLLGRWQLQQQIYNDNFIDGSHLHQWSAAGT
jgi:hypothetical protein